jgi:hypothetical protein
MTGRGVHEAGTGVVGDVIASDQRHVEIIAAAAQRVGAGDAFKFARSLHRATLVLSLALAKHSSASASAKISFSPG